MYCITTKNLSYRFNGQDTVLSDIELAVPKGAIYGFLGPNGAGKTTTLRLLLGLLKKQTGSIQFFEQDFEGNRLSILRKTGSLIEAPSIYAHLSASENLALLQKIYRCDKNRIDEVLKLVGLEHTGKKSAGKFSLGMKQRLSIAIALMHEPELLILDEPTNGLDPNGIIEIRELLKKLNQEQGLTILISSHLLAEIEKMVTHVGIINKGKLIFQGTMQSLHEAQQQQSVIYFETNNLPATKNILQAAGLPAVEYEKGLRIQLAEPAKVALVNSQLVEQGVAVYQISVIKNDLESIFMDLIK